MPELHIKSGSIRYETDEIMTIRDVVRLVESAALIGIPMNSQVMDIRINQAWSSSMNTQGTAIEIYWNAPREGD